MVGVQFVRFWVMRGLVIRELLKNVKRNYMNHKNTLMKSTNKDIKKEKITELVYNANHGSSGKKPEEIKHTAHT